MTYFDHLSLATDKKFLKTQRRTADARRCPQSKYCTLSDSALQKTAPVRCGCRLGCILAQPGNYDWTVHIQSAIRPYVKLLWPLVLLTCLSICLSIYLSTYVSVYLIDVNLALIWETQGWIQKAWLGARAPSAEKWFFISRNGVFLVNPERYYNKIWGQFALASPTPNSKGLAPWPLGDFTPMVYLSSSGLQVTVSGAILTLSDSYDGGLSDKLFTFW